MIHPNTKHVNRYAIIHRNGAYRTCLNSEATRERNLYGAEIIHSDLTVSKATEWQETYSRREANDLSNLFVYDHTLTIEARQQEDIQEFDVIAAQCTDGIYRTGSCVAWKAGIVWMEVGSTIYHADMNTAELVAKVDEGDWELTDEYDTYRNEIEDEYEFQTSGAVAA